MGKGTWHYKKGEKKRASRSPKKEGAGVKNPNLAEKKQAAGSVAHNLRRQVPK